MCVYSGTCEKRKETDSPLCVRRMASANVGDMSTVRIFGHKSFFSS